jgi:hypothetical protein
MPEVGCARLENSVSSKAYVIIANNHKGGISGRIRVGMLGRNLTHWLLQILKLTEVVS